MTGTLTCDECGGHVLYRMWRFGDTVRHTDICRSCRPPWGHDRQVAEDATEDDLRENTGLCLNCNSVFGTTWSDAPDTCNHCGEPLMRYDEVTIGP